MPSLFTWEPPQGFYASLLHQPMDVGTWRSGRGGGDKRVGNPGEKGVGGVQEAGK